MGTEPITPSYPDEVREAYEEVESAYQVVNSLLKDPDDWGDAFDLMNEEAPAALESHDVAGLREIARALRNMNPENDLEEPKDERPVNTPIREVSYPPEVEAAFMEVVEAYGAVIDTLHGDAWGEVYDMMKIEAPEARSRHDIEGLLQLAASIRGENPEDGDEE